MRIVAGKAKGRPLLGPKTPEIRPTADRVRETLFNILGQWCDGLSVLDLYTGTGALALEALSRGASHAVMVDSGREAQRLARANAEALGFLPQTELLAMDVVRAAKTLGKAGRRFELVFADPPYAARAVEELLTLVAENRLLAEGAIFVIEHDRRESAPETFAPKFQRVDQRRFGDTLVSFYREA